MDLMLFWVYSDYVGLPFYTQALNILLQGGMKILENLIVIIFIKKMACVDQIKDTTQINYLIPFY